jgi:hypothetical protein
MSEPHVGPCDLCDPARAREFLKDLRIKGKSITYVTVGAGRQIWLDRATDEEIVSIAHQLFHLEEGRDVH